MKKARWITVLCGLWAGACHSPEIFELPDLSGKKSVLFAIVREETRTQLELRAVDLENSSDDAFSFLSNDEGLSRTRFEVLAFDATLESIGVRPGLVFAADPSSRARSLPRADRIFQASFAEARQGLWSETNDMSEELVHFKLADTHDPCGRYTSRVFTLPTSSVASFVARISDTEALLGTADGFLFRVDENGPDLVRTSSLGFSGGFRRTNGKLLLARSDGALFELDPADLSMEHVFSSTRAAGIQRIVGDPDASRFDLFVTIASGGVLHFDGSNWEEILGNGPDTFRDVAWIGPQSALIARGEKFVWRYEGGFLEQEPIEWTQAQSNQFALALGKESSGEWVLGGMEFSPTGLNGRGLFFKFDGMAWVPFDIGQMFAFAPIDIFPHPDGFLITGATISISAQPLGYVVQFIFGYGLCEQYSFENDAIGFLAEVGNDLVIAGAPDLSRQNTVIWLKKTN